MAKPTVEFFCNKCEFNSIIEFYMVDTLSFQVTCPNCKAVWEFTAREVASPVYSNTCKACGVATTGRTLCNAHWLEMHNPEGR